MLASNVFVNALLSLYLHLGPFSFVALVMYTLYLLYVSNEIWYQKKAMRNDYRINFAADENYI